MVLVQVLWQLVQVVVAQEDPCPAAIRRYPGYDAVKLWAAYRRGRTDALDPLARYNLADAINLQALLRVSYNWAVSHDELPFRRFDNLQTENSEEATDKAVKNVMRAAEAKSKK